MTRYFLQSVIIMTLYSVRDRWSRIVAGVQQRPIQRPIPHHPIGSTSIWGGLVSEIAATCFIQEDFPSVMLFLNSNSQSEFETTNRTDTLYATRGTQGVQQPLPGCLKTRVRRKHPNAAGKYSHRIAMIVKLLCVECRIIILWFVCTVRMWSTTANRISELITVF